MTRPSKVVTLVGPGGVGKTRLAVEHGLRSLDRLARRRVVRRPCGVGRRRPRTGGRRRRTRGTDACRLRRTRRCRQSTWPANTRCSILDNAEHVREATARVVATILESSPGVGIFSTSREPLGLRAGERCCGSAHCRGTAAARHSADLRKPRCSCSSSEPPRPAQRGTTTRQPSRSSASDSMACRSRSRWRQPAPGVLTPDEILLGLDDAARSFVSRDPTLPGRHHSLDDLLAWSDRLLGET